MKLITFDKPAIADQLRKAGFCVIKQNINGVSCFAVEDCKELRDILSLTKHQYGESKFATTDKLYF